MKVITLPQIDPVQVNLEIIEFIKNKVKSMKKDGVIIGMSGGIDSSVTAALCSKAFQGMNYKILGLILPGNNTSENIQDNLDAELICNKFNIPFRVLNIQSMMYATNILLPTNINSCSYGNMVSRTRANILHTYAEIYNFLVCGTGNRDEDYGVGYYTLFGDGAVHMSPIGSLSKRMVYQMAKYFDLPESIIKKVPSARLKNGQTDFGDLGYDYDAVEYVLEGKSQGLKPFEIAQYLNYIQIKYDINKHKNVEDVIKDILKRHTLAKKKAKLVNPDVAKISCHYQIMRGANT